MKKIILSVLMIFLLSNPVYAQADGLPDPGTVPDSAFYGWEKIFESIGNAFTFGEVKKTERALTLAEEGLAEAEAMIVKGKPEFVDELSKEYEKEIDKANEIAGLAKDVNKKEQLTELVVQATLKHISILEEVKERVPEQAKERIALAMDKSLQGNKAAVDALSTVNPNKAADISNYFAEEKINEADVLVQRARENLQRGNELMDKGNYPEAEDAFEDAKATFELAEEKYTLAQERALDVVLKEVASKGFEIASTSGQATDRLTQAIEAYTQGREEGAKQLREESSQLFEIVPEIPARGDR